MMGSAYSLSQGALAGLDLTLQPPHNGAHWSAHTPFLPFLNSHPEHLEGTTIKGWVLS